MGNSAQKRAVGNSAQGKEGKNNTDGTNIKDVHISPRGDLYYERHAVTLQLYQDTTGSNISGFVVQTQKWQRCYAN